jgi:hypothetical protein
MGRSVVEDALWKLDELTLEARKATVAEAPNVGHSVMSERIIPLSTPS